jgi:diguanylate cyclase (GGDEF)-like protein
MMEKQKLRLKMASAVGYFSPFLFVRVSPETRHSPSFRWRVENIVIAVFIAAISLPAYAAAYYFLGDTINALFCLISTAAVLAVPVLLRLTGSPALARETLTWTLFLLLVGLSYRLGGISAPTIMWLAICPLIAMTAGGLRPGLTWSGLGFIAIIGMFIADISGRIPPVTITDSRVLWLVSICGFFATVALVIRFFEAASSNAIAKLNIALSTINDFAIRDDLTGILNRRESLRLAEMELARAQLQNVPFSLCLIDLDHFKQINDTYGHPVGDQVLKCVTSKIQSEIRKVDIFGRYGGEEFVLLLVGADAISAQELMERIRNVIADLAAPAPDVRKQVTISVGIAQYEKGMTIAALIAKADTMLYQAKRDGRNRVVIAAPCSL